MTIPARPRPTQTKHRTGQFSGMQVMFAAILTIGLFLAIDFSSRISSGQPIQQAYEQVSAEIELLRHQQADLIDLRNYARSDDYVALWARTEGKMVLPGEALVIPVPAIDDAAPAPMPELAPEDVVTTLPGPNPWQLWWSLFFDGPPVTLIP